VIAIMVVVSFWIFYKIWTKKAVLNDMITTLLISTYFLQPTIINMMAKIVSCKEIDPDKYYITTYLYFQCYTDQHDKYVTLKKFIFQIKFFLIGLFSRCAFIDHLGWNLPLLSIHFSLSK